MGACQGDPQGPPLDVARMLEAAAAFLGEHDFRNFCKVSARLAAPLLEPRRCHMASR